MKSFIAQSILMLCALFAISSTFAFSSNSVFVGRSSSSFGQIRKRSSSSSSLQMFFGPKKDDGKPGDYLCPDCGFVFTKGPDAWAKLPEDYRCPPCGAPKFRFKKVAKGSQSGKVEVKKSWF